MMKKHVVKRLKKRGWAEHEIAEAKAIIKARKKHDKSASIVHANRMLFWTAFVVIIIGNLLISMFLVPFLIMLSKPGVNLIIVVLGVAFGLLFNFIITDIEHLTRKHHYIAGIVIPIIAIINFFLITRFANKFGQTLGIGIIQDPYTISIVYVIAFIAPFILDRLLKKLRGR